MAADPIVTTQDLTLYQGGDAATLIEQATALIRRYCGWHITPEVTETVRLDGSGSAVQMLPSLHVTSVAAVTYDGAVLTPADYTWAEVGYLTFLRNGPYFSEHCGYPTGVIEVTFTHGYAEAPDVAKIIMDIVTHDRPERRGVTSKTAGPFSESYAEPGFLDSETALLDRYRLPPRP